MKKYPESAASGTPVRRQRRASPPRRDAFSNRQPADRKPQGRNPAEHNGRKNLLQKPSDSFAVSFSKALSALERAVPIPSAHKRELPFAVRDLSRMLTSERGDLNRSYWSAPRFSAAYLHFFLPWNIYRLAWLLPSLDLALSPGAKILDIGSGPLTLPIALWCARPELRSMPLTFVCSDVAVKPLEHGRTILKLLAGEHSPWKVELLRAPVEKALRSSRNANYNLIMAGNVLNELGVQKNEQPLALRLEDITVLAKAALAPKGHLFILEPGTRLGGKIIGLTRMGALAHGFTPLAPCTHCAACPMLFDPVENDRMHRQRGPSFSGWCHFTHPAENIPFVLAELGQRARLEKDSLALSCLLLAKPSGQEADRSAAASKSDLLDELEALYAEIMQDDANGIDPNEAYDVDGSFEEISSLEDRNTPSQSALCTGAVQPARFPTARVISAPIRLPEEDEPARYGCCEKGLALILDAVHIPSGAEIPVIWPAKERRDAKTGALFLTARSKPRFDAETPKVSEQEKNNSHVDKPKSFAKPNPGGRNDRSPKPRSTKQNPRDKDQKPHGKRQGLRGASQAGKRSSGNAGNSGEKTQR